MGNYSGEFMFLLHGLNDTMTNKYIYFGFGLVFYFVTLLVNLLLIITVILDKTLHEPMYLYICSLFVNGICGSSAFYPNILADLLTDSHVISYTACLTQTCVIYSYVLYEFTCLTVMAYDRYVAICKPLEYLSIMTHQKVIKLLTFICFFSILQSLVGAALTIRLPLCGNDIDKLYCSNWEVVKLSCTDVTVNNLYGYFLILFHASQAVLIIVSYIQIIKASLQSQAGKVKFMQTCLPHIITLLNFSVSIIFDVMYSRYGKTQGLQSVRSILGMEYLLVPPLLNPIIYGMNLSQIRRQFLKMFRCKIKAVF
ncbi:putative olfactory receptor 7A2 [Electrophorus electricus]|uniref:putative olfactory receptor 7A2 n=1 Tax=Electrophorus electricus TaxID=8005 RepID=UPI0015CFFE5C|nr:putative olfactory receptor 7A2 [Electrophorus electricus]